MLRILLAAVAGVFLLVETAEADLIDDLHGVLTDPLKIQAGAQSAGSSIDALRISVDNAITALLQLQRDTDEDITKYIEEFRSIIASVDVSIESNIKLASEELRSLTDNIHNKSISLIEEAECAFINTIDEAISRAFSSGVARLVSGKRIMVLPFKEKNCLLFSINCEEKEIEFKVQNSWSPRQKYERVRDKMLENLEKGVSPSSSAANLVGTYADLSRFAKLAQCSYRNDPYSLTLSKDRAYWNRKVSNWQFVTSR